ncbi:MAG: M15 family metallopeptidase [Deltaproteobacteria bacterium]|nr:M15 family metallopeptidase [Deltaproteobacteria bacterium]
MLATPYRAGPIAPVTQVDHDPGRARVERLFGEAYGATEKEVRAALVPWKLRGHTFLVHRRALPAFEEVRARLDVAVGKDPSLSPFFEHMGGTFAYRAIAGTTRKSTHSFGIAVDLDPSRGHYWRSDAKPQWKNVVPQAIVDAFEAEGFVWGGRWWHYDTMHFEWRPELFDCR